MGSFCNKSFCSSYMLLHPQEASFLDLFKILLISRKGKYFESFNDEAMLHRWSVFISILLQKVLRAVAKPLAWLGSVFETWLNLMSANGDFFGLMRNALKGKVVCPDRESARFKSVIGFIDKRVELEPKWNKKEDVRYYGGLCMMAAKLSYENHNCIKSTVEDCWKMDFLGSFDFWNDYLEKPATQAFILDDKKGTIVVAFRGTQPFDAYDWCSDVDISWYDLPGTGRIHAGFLKALGLQKSQGWPAEQDPDKPAVAYYAIRNLLKQKLESNHSTRFVITGHSLGGALAVLFAAILALHEEYSWMLDQLQGIYTFGQPRVGGEKLGQFVNEMVQGRGVKYLRFVYGYDMVPRLPYDGSTLMFKHFGTCVYYDSLYQGRIVEEEPDKNYFSVKWVVPKMANAWWELVRSFVIGYIKGGKYDEGGLLRMMRMVGLMVPGVSAHCPQDYLNAQMLGSLDI